MRLIIALQEISSSHPFARTTEPHQLSETYRRSLIPVVDLEECSDDSSQGCPCNSGR